MRKIILLTAWLLSGCHATTKQKMNTTNPMLCDPEKGTCEIPHTAQTNSNTLVSATEKPIRIIYFTDPICSACWGIEPQLRKLKLAYGDDIEIEYRMGGLLPSWEGFSGGGISSAKDVAHHWDEVSRYYDMPIDGNVWIEDPLLSSYPPSIAFKAAQMQDAGKAVAFLRRIREMVFTEKKNICRWENLEKAAAETGLDVKKMKTDAGGKAVWLFQEDLEMTRKMGIRSFPTMIFTNKAGKQLPIQGIHTYSAMEAIVQELHPGAKKKNIAVSGMNLFGYYPTMATKEFALLSGITTGQADELLNAKAADGEIEKFSTKNGIIWKAKK